MKKGNKIKFRNLFLKTMKDYKTNFYSIFKFMILFIGIPLLIFHIIGVSMVFSDNLFLQSILDTSMSSEETYFPTYYSNFGIISSAILILLFLFIYAGIISTSISKMKFSLSDIISNAKSNYLRLLFFTIIFSILIGILFLLLIIPGIIFLIFWLFGVYVYLDKKEDIFSSLKSSYKLVKEFWWKVFGYFIIFLLISMGLLLLKDLIIFLPLRILSFIYNTEIIPKWILVMHILINLIVTFLVNLLFVPNAIFFFKNLYLELNKVRKN